MPVNKGKARGGFLASDSTENCSLCTTAGALNLIQDTSKWTTEIIAKALNTTDSKNGLGDDSNAQAKAMKDYVAHNSIRRIEQKGSMNNTMNYSEAQKWMLGFQNGTVYALSLDGTIKQKTGSEGKIGHWLNARKENDSLTFYDFQTDREASGYGKTEVTVSDKPVVGIVRQLKPGETGELHMDSLKCYGVAFIDAAPREKTDNQCTIQ